MVAASFTTLMCLMSTAKMMNKSIKSPLISAANLERLLGSSTQTKILDVRGQWKTPTGPLYDEYAASHVPGAIFCDWTTDFIDTGAPRLGLASVANKADMVKSFDRLGIQENDEVIIYDASNHMLAARVWWSLKTWGFDNVSVLDGGWNKWVSLKLPVSGDIAEVVQGTDFEPKWQAHYETPLEDIIQKKDTDSMILMDCRKASSYNGKADDIRSGHIPGAINVAWTDTQSDDGTFKPKEQLEELFRSTIPVPDNVVASCGSGYCGAVMLLALEQAGIQAPLFDGSIALWKEDTNRSMEQTKL